MMLRIIVGVAGATEPDTLDSYACDTSCIASSLSMAGSVVWYEEPAAVHASESEPDGSLRTLTRLVRRNGVQELVQGPGCRQIVVEDLGSIQLVRTTHRLDADGACVEVESFYSRAVIPGEEGSPMRISPVKQLAAMATQAGLTFDVRTSLPWKVDFAGVTTLGEACRAVAIQDRLEGTVAAMHFGIRNDSLIVFHASLKARRPPRPLQDIQRDNDEISVIVAEARAATAAAAAAEAAETGNE